MRKSLIHCVRPTILKTVIFSPVFLDRFCRPAVHRFSLVPPNENFSRKSLQINRAAVAPFALILTLRRDGRHATDSSPSRRVANNPPYKVGGLCGAARDGVRGCGTTTARERSVTR